MSICDKAKKEGDKKTMKSIIEILPVLKAQVKQDVWESEEEAVSEHKLMRERYLMGEEKMDKKEKVGNGDLSKIDIFGRSEEEVRVGPYKEASE